MDGRAPAAGDEDEIAGHAPGSVPDRCAVGRQRTHFDPLDGPADGAHHHAARDELDLEALQESERIASRPALTCVHHRDDVRPRIQHRLDRLVGRIVVGEHHRPASQPDPVPERVGPRGGGEHDPGKVVVLERQGTLDGPGREHHLPGPDPPRPLPRAVRGRRRNVVGAPLHRDDHVVVVIAERGGAAQHPEVRARCELLADAGHEAHRVSAVDRGGGREEAVAESGRVVRDDDPGARARRGERGHQPGRPASHHEHVAEGVAAIVVVGVGLDRGMAQPRRLADEVLVEPPPRARPHEGLVVEAGRKQPRGDVAQPPHVEIERGPAVLAAGREPVIKLDLRRLEIRLGPGSLADANECIGLFPPRCEDAARAVVLEAAAGEPDAVRKQRGGQGVAPVPLVAYAVEGERERRGSIDTPSPLRPMGLPVHRRPPPPETVRGRRGGIDTGRGCRFIGARPRRDRPRAARFRARGGSTYRA